MDISAFFGKFRLRLFTPFLTFVLMTAVTTPASASRIHRLTAAQQDAQLQAIQTFLNGGVSVWSTTPPPIFPRSLLRTAAQQIAAGNETNLVQYLHWRQDLNPSRFNFYHPSLGTLLTNDTNAPTTFTVLPTPTVTTAKQTTTPTTTVTPNKTVTPAKVLGDQNATPPHVPEPSTTLIAVALVGAFAWKTRKIPARS